MALTVFPCPNSTADQFGWDGNPYDNDPGFNPSDYHPGHDIFGQIGDPIVACVSGVIDSNRYGGSWIGGLRLWILGDDGRGYYHAHCSELVAQPGQRVSAGQLMARMGLTGDAGRLRTSPHLHLGCQKDGVWIDVYSELIEAFTRQEKPILKTREVKRVEAIVLTEKNPLWHGGYFNPDDEIRLVGYGVGSGQANEVKITYRDITNPQQGFATKKGLINLQGAITTPRGDWGGRETPCTVVIEWIRGSIKVEKVVR